LTDLAIGIDGRELQGRPTGVGRYLRSLLRRWLDWPLDRLVVYVKGEPPADAVLGRPGIEVRPLPAGRGPGVWWAERVLVPAAARDGLDVFFAPGYTCPLSLRLPRVTCVHDLSFFSWPEDFTIRDGLRRRELVRASVRASDTVVTVSAFSERELARYFPDLTSRFVHIPPGPDEDLPPPPSRRDARVRVGAKGPVLLTVGSILNRRRLPVLLRAVAALRRNWPGLVLEVVGDNRTHPPLPIEALVDEMGLHSSVRVTGYVSEQGLVARYAAADVFVFLSEYEGFGLPVLEAMGRGLPVVTSTRPALGEIFGAAALLVDPTDDVALAAAIERLLSDPGLVADLVARGQRLRQSYSWEQTASRTREVLLEAAGKGA
jgi:glycosyltransferase involved in cell wall biosynthesis